MIETADDVLERLSRLGTALSRRRLGAAALIVHALAIYIVPVLAFKAVSHSTIISSVYWSVFPPVTCSNSSSVSCLNSFFGFDVFIIRYFYFCVNILACSTVTKLIFLSKISYRIFYKIVIFENIPELFCRF